MPRITVTYMWHVAECGPDLTEAFISTQLTMLAAGVDATIARRWSEKKPMNIPTYSGSTHCLRWFQQHGSSKMDAVRDYCSSNNNFQATSLCTGAQTAVGYSNRQRLRRSDLVCGLQTFYGNNCRHGHVIRVQAVSFCGSSSWKVIDFWMDLMDSSPNKAMLAQFRGVQHANIRQLPAAVDSD